MKLLKAPPLGALIEAVNSCLCQRINGRAGGTVCVCEVDNHPAGGSPCVEHVAAFCCKQERARVDVGEVLGDPSVREKDRQQRADAQKWVDASLRSARRRVELDAWS